MFRFPSVRRATIGIKRAVVAYANTDVNAAKSKIFIAP